MGASLGGDGGVARAVPDANSLIYRSFAWNGVVAKMAGCRVCDKESGNAPTGRATPLGGSHAERESD